ncbi:hypothetical protein BJI67_15595 [Acidihalobacter aeolianus]|uniref:Transposase IS4-like domain-containing protein n=1 Tax=Acidihalobacter aeolianus TaxID=2792603 RepID=A0A1D8KBJ4_9GAMM|nr:hypothetical protein BJI67_15595 [Acidihalobacter aeolianus]
MHQTKKSNPWHFGMKAPIGADANSGLVHTVVATSAQIDDVTQVNRLPYTKSRWLLAMPVIRV